MQLLQSNFLTVVLLAIAPIAPATASDKPVIEILRQELFQYIADDGKVSKPIATALSRSDGTAA